MSNQIKNKLKLLLKKEFFEKYDTLFVCDEISVVIICLDRLTISEETTSNN